MKVECCIQHGSLTFPENNISLEDMVPYCDKFYNHRPRMIKYHKNGVTLLIFTSLRFRLMGKGDQHQSILKEFLQKLPWKSSIGEMSVNRTISHQLPMTNINLHKLNQQYFQIELELFPAAKLIHAGREHVNVFHTGHIIITGVRDMNRIEYLIEHVLSCITSAIY